MKSGIKVVILVFLVVAVNACSGSPSRSSEDRSGDPRKKNSSADPSFTDAPQLEIIGDDLGTVIINTAKVAEIVIKNDSLQNVSDLGVERLEYPFAFSGGAFPGLTGTCGNYLRSGESCSIAVEISSRALAGSVSSPAMVVYKFQGMRFEMPFFVKAQFRDLPVLMTGNIDFGSIDVGNRTTKKLTLKNPSINEQFTSLTITLPVNSKFTIKAPASCSTIEAAATCTLDVSTTPKASGYVSEIFEIDYDVMGTRKKVQILVSASPTSVTDQIEVTQPQTVSVTPYNKPGLITLRVNQKNYNSPENIRIGKKELANSGFALDSASDCAGKTLNSWGSKTCNLVLRTLQPLTQTRNIKQDITLTYNADNFSKTKRKYTFAIKMDLSINTLTSSNSNLGQLPFKQGETVLIPIIVNNPPSSSIAQAHSLQLFDKPGAAASPVPYVVDPTSTCLAKKSSSPLTAGQQCTFVLRATPASVGPFNRDFIVTYVDGSNNVLQMPITATGNFEKIGVQNAGVTAISDSQFGPIVVNNGSYFDVTLTVTNTDKVVTLTALDLHRYDDSGTKLINWQPYFIQKHASSTCPTAALKPNGSCTFVLRVTPDPKDPINLDRKFAIGYQKSSSLQAEIHDFPIKGTWNILFAGGQLLSQINLTPPVVKDGTQLAHEYFSYEKRILVPLTKPYPAQYPEWVWKLLTVFGNTYTFSPPSNLLKHVPWVFKSTPESAIVKLKDIVPDRIIDPTTGKSYVKLYHGTTSENLNIFNVGSGAIRFDVAEITALGDGFYLAGNANESKAYACQRYRQRKATNPNGFQAILLVVGVEENDVISGQLTFSELSTSKAQAKAGGPVAGDPLNPSVHFRRNNNGMPNQFVFFSNVKPYLKIFEIIKLGSGFGMATSVGTNAPYYDADGLPVDDTRPDVNPNYRCTY